MTWSPPPEMMYKVNVDAAFNTPSGSGGIGIMVRDNCSQFMAGKTKSLSKEIMHTKLNYLLHGQDLALLGSWVSEDYS